MFTRSRAGLALRAAYAACKKRRVGGRLVVMAMVSLVIVISIAVGGGFTLETVYRGLITTPLQWAGGALGAWLFLKIPVEIFKKITLVALVGLGISVAVF